MLNKTIKEQLEYPLKVLSKDMVLRDCLQMARRDRRASFISLAVEHSVLRGMPYGVTFERHHREMSALQRKFGLSDPHGLGGQIASELISFWRENNALCHSIIL